MKIVRLLLAAVAVKGLNTSHIDQVKKCDLTLSTENDTKRATVNTPVVKTGNYTRQFSNSQLKSMS